jgi:hypothetical protein
MRHGLVGAHGWSSAAAAAKAVEAPAESRELTISLYFYTVPGFLSNSLINDVTIQAASFRCTLFLTRVPKGTGRF